MSLLLEALKRAEKAKEEAQRRTRGEQLPAAPTELRLEIDPPSPPAEKHVMTRDELPDISQPLEIRTDDFSQKTAVTPEPTLAPPPPPKKAPAAAPRKEEPQAGERAAAKKVFEAKFKEPNPRLPFYIAVGVLSVFAVGTGGYFWYQLRPPPALVNSNPPSGGAQPAAVAVAQPVTSAPVGTTAAAAAPAPGIPGLPGSPSAGGRSPEPQPPAMPSQPQVPAPAPLRPVEPATAPVRVAPPTPLTRAAGERSTDVSIVRPAPRVHPKVESGYSSYLAGNLAEARSEYQQALRDEPSNRDALLGIAALDVRSGNFEAAEGAYLRLLQADPRDAQAQAGLIALRGGRMDPLVSESRVKTLLAADPGAHVLNFTLGNQLAQQGRWAEAQQQYFKAFAAEPDNADFAYNLAVSLDHVRQPKLALEYYRRALTLADKRGGGFDSQAARERIAQLSR